MTLGFDPARFQTEPPACYRASWQLTGRDSHPQAATSLCWISYSISTSNFLAHCGPDERQQLGIGREEFCSRPRIRKSTAAYRAMHGPALAVVNYRRESNAGLSRRGLRRPEWTTSRSLGR